MPEPAPAREHSVLWSRVTDPNGDQIRMLLGKARLSMSRADAALATDVEWAVDVRARFYRDAYNLAAYARTLAPDDPAVLGVFAHAADELGRTTEALQALERAGTLAGAERAPVEVTGRLGLIYLRLGEIDKAMRWLRIAQGQGRLTDGHIEEAHALVHLATAYAVRGDLATAAHTLSNALPEGALQHYSNELRIVAFALAVFYDRDEQRALAFEVLDHMRTTIGDGFLEGVQVELARLPYVPPEDVHYFRALLYEADGHYVEARASWAVYAASGQPAFRGRALDHIAAIDAQRRAIPGAKRLQQNAPARAIPRRLPRP